MDSSSIEWLNRIDKYAAELELSNKKKMAVGRLVQWYTDGGVWWRWNIFIV